MAEVTIIDMGIYSSVTAIGISGDGSTVFGAGTVPSGGLTPFYWNESNGTVEVLGPPTTHTDVFGGASADGSTLLGQGWIETPTVTFGKIQQWLWTQGGGTVVIGDAEPRIGQEAAAAGISSDGLVVASTDTDGPNGPEAIRWTQSTGFVGLGALAGGGFFHSAATATSADGSVVVGHSQGPDGFEAFRWTAGTGMVGLGFLADTGSYSRPVDVSDDGQVVVGQSGSLYKSSSMPFRWTAAEGMVGLGDLPGGTTYGAANAVSGDGSVIAGDAYNETYGWTAFLWDAEHGMRSLTDVVEALGVDLGGMELEFAEGISTDGSSIVGHSRVTPGAPYHPRVSWIVDFLEIERPVVDVEPGSLLNVVQIQNEQVIAVAVRGSADFHASDVDGSSLLLGPGQASPMQPQGSQLMYANADLYPDLVNWYDVRKLGLELGDTELCLTGQMRDETPVEGCDSVMVFGACGLGFELALVLPPLIWLRSRKRTFRRGDA